MLRGRVDSFAEFWPQYLAKHRSPICRYLNFIGFTGLSAFIAHGLVVAPVTTSLALLVHMLGLSVFARKVEKKRASPGLFLLVLLGGVVFNPAHMAPGLVWAYFCAWIGHDQLEGNRRTLLSFPAWSLVADFRLYFLMLRGHLWTRSSFARAEI